MRLFEQHRQLQAQLRQRQISERASSTASYRSNIGGKVVDRSIAGDSEWGGAPLILRPPTEHLGGILRAVKGQWRGVAKGYCALALEKTLAPHVEGWSPGGMGHAGCDPTGEGHVIEKRLRKMGYLQADGEAQPGDIVIFKQGGGGYGHIGVAVKPGAVKTEAPAAPRPPRPEPTSPLERLDALLTDTADLLGESIANSFPSFGGEMIQRFRYPGWEQGSPSMMTDTMLALTEGMPEVQQIILWAYEGAPVNAP